jgi:hypothetical protein
VWTRNKCLLLCDLKSSCLLATQHYCGKSWQIGSCTLAICWGVWAWILWGTYYAPIIVVGGRPSAVKKKDQMSACQSIHSSGYSIIFA